MSEASDSLQVRTDDPEACVAKLREGGLNGFVFRGDRGWLTVVPYGIPDNIVPLDGLDEDLAPFLGAPVIQYTCHADFGWSFSLTLPDGRTTAFQCWSSESASDGKPLDEAILAEVVPPERVRPFLGPPPAEPDGDGPAYGFARAMDFPQFEWLSPAYVVDDPDDARSRGGEEIGSPDKVSPEAAFRLG